MKLNSYKTTMGEHKNNYTLKTEIILTNDEKNHLIFFTYYINNVRLYKILSFKISYENKKCYLRNGIHVKMRNIDYIKWLKGFINYLSTGEESKDVGYPLKSTMSYLYNKWTHCVMDRDNDTFRQYFDFEIILNDTSIQQFIEELQRLLVILKQTFTENIMKKINKLESDIIQLNKNLANLDI